jgi:arylsulfatase A-like enzyme
VDRHLGIFFAFLKKSGVWKDSLIILTSDHGEEFMEHNMLGHERHLYDTLLQVPLIIKLPDTTPKRVSRIAQLTEMVDIMPTILDYLNIAPLSQAQGKSLLPFLRGKETDHKEQIFAAVSSREKQSHFSSMVRNNRLKCIIPDRIHPSILQFYTIGSNHGEEQPDFSISEPASNILMRVLKEHQNNCLKLYHLKYSRNRTEIGQDHTQSKKVKQNLKTLGYLK